MKRSCVLLIVLAFSCTAWSQQPVITPDTPVDSATLLKWLHSGDPRLVAWAADFARRNHDSAVIAAMPDWLEHWPMPPLYGDIDWPASQKRQVAAVPILAVLDVLIQQNAKVPLTAISAVAAAFPAQAAILIARYPLSESRRNLEEWMWAAQGLGTQRLLAKIAFMMLAKDPTKAPGFWQEDPFANLGFVASVVAQSQLELHIFVNADGRTPDLSGAAACGDSGGRRPSPGWPDVYGYQLLEGQHGPEMPVLVELKGERLSVNRYKSNGVPAGSCHGEDWLNPNYTWHELMAYWLGVSPEKMSWLPNQNVGVKWSGKAAYQRQLGEIVESERQILRRTVEALRKRGLLTQHEAGYVMPKLVITVTCDIKPCPLK